MGLSHHSVLIATYSSREYPLDSLLLYLVLKELDVKVSPALTQFNRLKKLIRAIL